MFFWMIFILELAWSCEVANTKISMHNNNTQTIPTFLKPFYFFTFYYCTYQKLPPTVRYSTSPQSLAVIRTLAKSEISFSGVASS